MDDDSRRRLHDSDEDSRDVIILISSVILLYFIYICLICRLGETDDINKEAAVLCTHYMVAVAVVAAVAKMK